MTAERHSEVERKYDVPPGCPVPDLGVLPGVASVSAPVRLDQVATYVDTASLGLHAAGITLRHRTGGVDDGWHLKLPGSGDERLEVRVPDEGAHRATAPPADAPEELVALVRVHVRERALSPVAVLRTRRLVHRLLDAEGTVLAELCEDHVHAETATGRPAVRDWCEWELELVAGAAGLLEAAEPVLRAAGARPATASSKLGRVLAGRLPPPAAPLPRRVRRGSVPTTGEVLVAYLAEHVAALERQDCRLRAGDPEGVHQMRVAARRLRSALATYAPVLEPAARPLRDELSWLGGVLGQARDAEVLRLRLDDLLDTEPAGAGLREQIDSELREQIDGELRERARAGELLAGQALDGERYRRLVDDLERLVREPPLNAAAGAPARLLVADLVEADLARVLRRRRRVARADDERRTAAWHEVRKAAKRLRYAAESARPVLGKPAKRLAARAEAVQSLLGEHQDTVVARSAVLAIAERVRAAGASSFTLGRLHAREEARAAALEQLAPAVLDALPRRIT